MSGKETGRSAGGEFYIERGKITQESLRRDNGSPEAEKRRKEWEENRELKRLTLLATCSDARIVTPNPSSSVVIRSIAAGKDLEPFGNLIQHKSIDNVHIMGHHSGKATTQGDHPRGCGGLGVKEDQMLHQKFPHTDLEDWVSDNVCHSDSLFHALAKAADIQEFTEKEILLSTQDHLDHTIYPMAGFLGTLITPIHYEDIGDYDSRQIYKDGIPSLATTDLQGTTFEEYMRRYDEVQLPDLLASPEHDTGSQEIQAPKMLLITTNVRPPEVCYPELTKKPNRVFVETVAREKVRDEFIVSDRAIRDVVTQARYPISHFSSINTLFIETGDIRQSTRIARAFEERPWFPAWMERSATNIILGESKAGRIEALKGY